MSAKLKTVDEYVQEIMSLLFGYQYSEGTPLEISVRDLRSLIGLVQVDTTFVNASVCNERYEPRNAPIVVDL